MKALIKKYVIMYVDLVEIGQSLTFFFFAPDNKCVHELCSCAPNSLLPKLYISIKFGMICSKIDENINDS